MFHLTALHFISVIDFSLNPKKSKITGLPVFCLSTTRGHYLVLYALEFCFVSHVDQGERRHERNRMNNLLQVYYPEVMERRNEFQSKPAETLHLMVTVLIQCRQLAIALPSFHRWGNWSSGKSYTTPAPRGHTVVQQDLIQLGIHTRIE